MKNNEADDARKNEIYKNKILTVPNVLSAFRLLLVPALAWLYLVRKDYSATAWVLLLSGATDIADGFIARRFGMVCCRLSSPMPFYGEPLIGWFLMNRN